MPLKDVPDRRRFLKLAAAGTGALGLGISTGAGGLGCSAPTPDVEGGGGPPPSRTLDLLILGGTGFIGPHQVEYAVSRGHRVSVFNRGRSGVDLPDEVEELVGDRNDDLSALEGREWDVVIDNPTTLPNWVRTAGRLLRDSTDLYVFTSTLSVYADTSQPGMDETTPVLDYTGDDDPFELEPGQAGGYYGPLKALCEREAAYWFPGRATIVRPGLIVGPGDPTDRFTYWPVRIDRGGEVLAPGTPEDATQVIDVRDLGEWVIHLVEEGHTGVFNATGQPQGIGEMLGGIRDALDAEADFTWVPQDFLEEQGVRGWSDMPVWVPLRDENRGFMQVSTERARERGLTYRPFHRTARDTMEWFRTLPTDRREELRAGIDAEREREVLEAWHATVE